MHSARSSTGMPRSCWQVERKAVSARQVLQVLLPLLPLPKQKMPQEHLSRLTKTEVVLCLVKVPASWSLRNWSMRRQEAQGFTPSLSVTVQQLMLSISLLRQRTEQAQQEQWNWQWKKPAYSHLRWNTSTHMEQARTTTTCLRQERSTRHLEMRQKIWL